MKNITLEQPKFNFQSNTSCFSQENFARLQEIMYDAKVCAGDRLFWEGERADKLYFIHKGSIKIIKSSDEGKQLILHIFQEGDLFGEIDQLNEPKHNYSAEVMEDAIVGMIQQNDLDELLWKHGNLAVEFTKWLGLIHRTTQTKLRDLMMYGKPGALCSVLIRLSNSYGVYEAEQILISQKFTNTELADMIGATRESVNRMLGDLRKKKVIEMHNGHLVINNLNYLRDVCRCEDCPQNICRI